MQEVARLADVSKATVSKVCNGSFEISQATAARVRKVLEETGYTKNIRQQVKSATKNIGLIIRHPSQYVISNPFLCEVLIGLFEVFSEMEFTTSFYWEKEFDYSRLYSEGLVDGILLLMPPYNDPMVEKLQRSGCPAVCIGEHALKEKIRYIDSNDEEGLYRAVQFLYGQNHRKFAYLGGDPTICSGIKRQRGFRRAIRDLGCETGVVFPSSTNLQQQGMEMAKKLLCLTSPPTALLCFNDMVAMGAIKVIVEEGLRVPGDFSVIGYDNIYLCDYTQPRLTTVNNIAKQKGRDAARWLLDVIQMGSENVSARPMLLPVDLIVRESTRVL